jgi:hypothetical protein
MDAAQQSQEPAVNDPLANLPKNPPIYQGSGFDPSPLEKAAELVQQV